MDSLISGLHFLWCQFLVIGSTVVSQYNHIVFLGKKTAKNGADGSMRRIQQAEPWRDQSLHAEPDEPRIRLKNFSIVKSVFDFMRKLSNTSISRQCTAFAQSLLCHNNNTTITLTTWEILRDLISFCFDQTHS